MLTRPINRVAFAPLGLFPTYCLDDTDRLAVSYNYGSQTMVQEAHGTFLDRDINVGFALMEGASVAARGKVTTLAVYVPKPDEFEPTPEMVASSMEVRISGGVMANGIIKKVNPTYPSNARNARISGSVVLSAKVGTDGHVHNLRVMSAPDPDLAIAAIAAVRQWTYKPYLLNGGLVDVDTTVTVNFNLTPR